MSNALTLELRDAGEHLEGVVIQEGRMASARSEVFAPGSLRWPADGIEIRTVHRGPAVARTYPHRGTDGVISVRVPVNPEIRSAYDDGRRDLSIEFYALQETRNASRAREIQSALLTAAAMVEKGEYHQARGAEIRQKSATIGAIPWL